MQKWLIYVIWLSVVCAPKVTALSSYQFDRWQTDEGLPQSTVTSIAQTRDGYLWLGTQNGLVRFDGVNFKVFNRNNTRRSRTTGWFNYSSIVWEHCGYRVRRVSC